MPIGIRGSMSVNAEPKSRRRSILASLKTAVLVCKDCRLHRSNKIFGDGSLDGIMFISEAPGKGHMLFSHNQLHGRQLQAALALLGLRRRDVYITTLVKCSPGLRAPYEDEINACNQYLMTQIALIGPTKICVLGRVAAIDLGLMKRTDKMTCGKWIDFKGIKTIVAWHPSYIARNHKLFNDWVKQLRVLV